MAKLEDIGPAERADARAEDLERLIQASLGNAGSLDAMVDCISSSLGACGCALWECTPPTDPTEVGEECFLFTVASRFNADADGRRPVFAIDSLPLADSATGKVISSGKAEAFPAIREQGGWGRNHPFLGKRNIGRMASAPMRYLDGCEGALNVYRHDADPPFTPDDLVRLKRFASAVPALFRGVRERVGHKLVREIDAIIQTSGSTAHDQSPTEVDTSLRSICQKVAEAMNLLEVSILLEDWAGSDPALDTRATTATWRFPKLRYTREDMTSFTSWVLRTEKPLNLRNLKRLESDRESLLRQYPGLPIDNRNRDDEALATTALGCSREELPPLSFLAVPIPAGTRVCGVLRCHLSISGPFYFTQNEVELLQVAAAQVGYFWSAWIGAREARKRAEAWQKLVTASLGSLNDLVMSQVDTVAGEIHEEAVFEEALRALGEAWPDIAVASIRVLDAERQELRFAAVSQRTWNPAEQATVSKGLKRRFPVSEPPRSIGAKVVREGKPALVPDVAREPLFTPLFPGVGSMLVTPISVRNTVYGVLDVRWFVRREIPEWVQVAATLLGRQLGLYHDLFRSVRAGREAEAKSLKEEKDRGRMFEDLAHQIRGPLILAQRRASAAVKTCPEKDQRQLMMLRGLCRKAGRVANSMRLLSDLAHGRPPALKIEGLTGDWLVRLAIELAEDVEMGLDPVRQIHFTVDRSGFEGIPRGMFRVDCGLLEQVLHNLYDNAAKYSYSNTTVKIRGGVSQSGRLYVSVANRGIEIREGDVSKVWTRLWRAPEATAATGDGSGIGLWLVREIMRAHGGGAEINRRNPEGMTEVRIYFQSVRQSPT